MPTLRNPDRFAAYRELLKDPGRALSFSQLRVATGKTGRVLSNQLRRLVEGGVVVRRPAPRPGDRRSRWHYQVGRGWPWIERHEQVMAGVARSISDRRVFHGLAAGARDPGSNGVLVYTNLIVETGRPMDDDTYPTGTQNLPKVKRALKAIRHALEGEDPLGYHWQFLLRRVIVEIVTSQRRPFFLLSYPATNFGPGGNEKAWPDPDWWKLKAPAPGTVPPRGQGLGKRDLELFGRFGVEYLGFRKRHLTRAHPKGKSCRCSEDRLIALMVEFRRRRMRSWAAFDRSHPPKSGQLGRALKGRVGNVQVSQG